jgi:hypothetical protein
MDAQLCRGLVLNVPEFFADAGFRRWLENDVPKFTWHRGGEVDEWSDVVVLVDPGLTGEGSDSDMPASIWDRIIDLCRMHLGSGEDQQHHYMVRLTNLTV